jgi:hypothetical protein
LWLVGEVVLGRGEKVIKWIICYYIRLLVVVRLWVVLRNVVEGEWVVVAGVGVVEQVVRFGLVLCVLEIVFI